MKEHEPLAQYTTFGIGGTAQYFVDVKDKTELLRVLEDVKKQRLRYWILAGGSNVVCSDSEIPGVCIRVATGSVEVEGTTILADAGTKLGALVDTAIDAGLEGLETLSGIPGTVGGAIVGNAAAYGQAISGPLVRVEIFDGETVRWIKKEECGFTYRDSLFKAKPWIALRAEFVLKHGNSAALREKAKEIIALREKKYPPGIKCPGSYFKNLLLENLSLEAKALVPENRDFYGKVPAWFFLNEVGARGMVQGGLRIADIHGNLILNEGGATYEDAVALAAELKKRVREKFGVELEEEVRYIQ